uniref:Predicted protein n=1 Tax=Hordeum vulgare subsp. vulgare TaxID=112509 RepID=F2DA83_HORVV|nr:predicted protein [Hordeum vulgare subsp. vulgare]BAJ92429.1 predicted protein [Hordeum vulgare subsp. vulgare]
MMQIEGVGFRRRCFRRGSLAVKVQRLERADGQREKKIDVVTHRCLTCYFFRSSLLPRRIALRERADNVLEIKVIEWKLVIVLIWIKPYIYKVWVA